MLDQTPLDFDLKTWMLISILSFAGGFTNWISKRKRTFMELIGEIVLAYSIGTTAFFVLAAYEYNILLCLGGCSVGSHLSTRLLFVIQNILAAKEKILIKKILKGEENDTDIE